MKEIEFTADVLEGALLGIAVGDALGVPVEFQPRQRLDMNPVNDMRAFGTHNQPAGTWSDDSSLTFCLADSLTMGYNLADMAQRMVNWKRKAYWSAGGRVFDIGIKTSTSLDRLENLLRNQSAELVIPPHEAHESDNGNGALMRIMPLAFWVANMDIEQRFAAACEVASLTHGHIRSHIACFIHNETVLQLLQGKRPQQAYSSMQGYVTDFLAKNAETKPELIHFYRLLKKDISQLSRSEIESSGYVVHTLEAAFWCWLNNDTYSDVVINAVNLGSDTDTTAAVAGGLAGITYGKRNIPSNWLKRLARISDIELLAVSLHKALKKT